MKSHHLFTYFAFISTLLIPSTVAVTKVFTGGSFEISDSIAALPAGEPFLAADVVQFSGTSTSRRSRLHGRRGDVEERGIVPEYLYVLYCTDAGFRGQCEAFGSHPGQCVSFFDYDTGANLSAIFNDNVESLSTNTGGLCQVYNTIGCDADNSDTGFSVAYAYDLGSADPNGYIGVGPFNGYDRNNSITSWKC